MSSGNDYWSGIYSRSNGQSLQDAERSYLLANGGVSGSNDDLWFQALRAWGATGSLPDMKKKWIDDGAVFSLVEAYMDLDGTGDYADWANLTAASITGAIEIQVGFSTTDVLTSGELIGKWQAPSDYSWCLIFLGISKTVILYISHNGTTLVSAVSDSALTIVNDQVVYVKATWDGATDVYFYTSVDGGENWTILGTKRLLTNTGIHTSDNDIQLGAISTPTGDLLTGQVHYAKVLDGIGGTTLTEFQPDGQVGKTSFDGWTLNGDAEIVAV